MVKRDRPARAMRASGFGAGTAAFRDNRDVQKPTERSCTCKDM